MNPQTLQHLKELRQRLTSVLLITGLLFALAYWQKEVLFQALAHPLLLNTHTLIFTGVPELFFTYLKLSFFTGLFITTPLLLWQLWRFIAPGLYKQEANGLKVILFCTPLLFYAGGAFMHFAVMPLAVQFFFSFATESIHALPSVQAYFAFYTKMMFAFGLAFTLPIAILLLTLTGITTIQTLKNNRRYTILSIAVAAAILTPPDPISQLLLAVPLYLLYEAAIFIAQFTQKKPQEKQE